MIGKYFLMAWLCWWSLSANADTYTTIRVEVVDVASVRRQELLRCAIDVAKQITITSVFKIVSKVCLDGRGADLHPVEKLLTNIILTFSVFRLSRHLAAMADVSEENESFIAFLGGFWLGDKLYDTMMRNNE
jgi:hypothetical protein